MKKTIHRADSRGYFDYGWLQTHHTFSFASYYDPDRLHFGKLRVLNDDVVAAGHGFGTHPHDNMEIVSMPLRGELAHKDSAGHEQVIRPGDIQVMSAGTGIQHSEYNHSDSEPAGFLQIWVLPDKQGHSPRYDQRTFEAAGRHNQFQTLVAPKGAADTLWLNQNAYFSLAELEAGRALTYRLHDARAGVYCFILEGDVGIAEERLAQRDGIGIWDVQSIEMTAQATATILAIEVPITP